MWNIIKLNKYKCLRWSCCCFYIVVNQGMCDGLKVNEPFCFCCYCYWIKIIKFVYMCVVSEFYAFGEMTNWFAGC